jgi:5-methylcytosine-specific restriction endonuclease McrBC GTP-binding regulatory subunit McrB
VVKLFRDFSTQHNIHRKQHSTQPLKNYVLIIDEINRANISRVFGELITLLEEDKRWGNDFETEVLLPDGFTKFTVPKNLYIIGTMNTADKSIALLDIALRRRFEFIPLYPDASKVKDEYQLFFNTLNQRIKDKKGIDFCIGHAYFMPPQDRSFDFVKAMNQKVIPLLMEYFYNAELLKMM